MSMDFWNIAVAVAQIVSSAVAIIGIIYIAVQVRDTRRFTKAQVMNELERESREHKIAFQLVTTTWKSGTRVIPNDKDLYELFACLGWFERMKILLDNKVIDWHTLDELFAYRFFLIVNNKNVQEHILYPDNESFRSIFMLHSNWRTYRRKQNETIFHDNTDLAEFDPAQYQRTLNIYVRRS